jgi:hypothetical protein
MDLVCSAFLDNFMWLRSNTRKQDCVTSIVGAIDTKQYSRWETINKLAGADPNMLQE